MIAFLMIAGLGVLALLSRLAALTRMTIPLLYTVSMLTVFHGWYRTHTVLADRILFALVGLVVLSWLLSLIRFVCDLVTAAFRSCPADRDNGHRGRENRCIWDASGTADTPAAQARQAAVPLRSVPGCPGWRRGYHPP